MFCTRLRHGIARLLVIKQHEACQYSLCQSSCYLLSLFLFTYGFDLTVFKLISCTSWMLIWYWWEFLYYDALEAFSDLLLIVS